MELLSEAMSFNYSIKEFYLNGNIFHNKWNNRVEAIMGGNLKSLYTIEYYLCRNRLNTNRLLTDYSKAIEDEIDDDVDNLKHNGNWLKTRKWKEIDFEDLKQKEIKKNAFSEESRIKDEDEYINDKVEAYRMHLIDCFNDKSFKDFFKVFGEFVYKYFYHLNGLHQDNDLNRLVKHTYLQNLMKLNYLVSSHVNIDEEVSIYELYVQCMQNSIETTDSRRVDVIDNKSLSSVIKPGNQALLENDTKNDEEIPQFNVLNPLTGQSLALAYPLFSYPYHELIWDMHITILWSLFQDVQSYDLKRQVNNFNFSLSPVKLEELCLRLTVPLHPYDVQNIVNNTIIKNTESIGLFKFSSYFRNNVVKLSQKNKFKRMMLLTETYTNLPIIEAKGICMDYLLESYRLKIINEYRSLSGKNTDSFIFCDYTSYSVCFMSHSKQATSHVSTLW